jgi:hypothetical protein
MLLSPRSSIGGRHTITLWPFTAALGRDIGSLILWEVELPVALSE